MKELLTSAIKKVTLELIYQVVEERTRDILEVVNEIKKRQEEEDFRYLNQKIDNQIAQLNQKIDSQIAQLNQRIDTIIQLLIDIKSNLPNCLRNCFLLVSEPPLLMEGGFLVVLTDQLHRRHFHCFQR